ncbi:hypothetical protein [Smaragdicoccus niigatensis]|uniref:hypothetical protein n=1 Tax=Smaragdicoccus niigatensis TaxID=359359 RepID=UPI0003609337|nr:hypothetical protein [Smaragdicoccus niigatensis]
MRITLCAASLTAAAALFTALPAATAAPSAKSSTFTPEQQTLLSHISSGYNASDCKPAEREDGANYLAVISCKNHVTGAPKGVVYFLYDSQGQMDADFDATLDALVRAENCGQATNPGTWGPASDSEAALGRLGCGTSDDHSTLLWTTNSTQILSYAAGTDDIDALMTWWRKNG